MTEGRLPPRRSPLLLMVLAFAASVSGCTLYIPSNGPLTIRAPSQGDTLIPGALFPVLADFDVEEPQYGFEYFLVELSDASSGFTLTWQIDAPPHGEARILDQTFILPREAPTGEGYRLSVSAQPGISLGISSIAVGHSIEVRVSPQP